MYDSLGNKVPDNATLVRATELTQFRNCRRNWWFHSHNGLNLESRTPSPKLRFGTCWHRGLEKYYETFEPSRRSLNDLMEGIDLGFEEEAKRMSRIMGPGQDDPEIRQQVEQERLLAHELAKSYFMWANSSEGLDAPEVPDTELRTVMTEKRLVIPIPTPQGNKSRSWLAVKVDTVVENKEGVWVMEHKSMGKSSKVDNPDNLPLDIQMTLQVWALEQFLNQNSKEKERVPVRGALYNLTRKQSPGPRVKNPIHGRHRVRRSRKELENAISALYHDASIMREAAKSQHLLYHNPQPWASGFCSWGCAGKEVCIAMNRGEDYESLIDNDFIERDRTIWEILEEELND